MTKINLSTKPIILKSKKINTLEFNIVYPIKTDLKKLYYIDFLDIILHTTSKKYPKQNDYKKELDKLLIMRFNTSVRRVVDQTYIMFTFSLPKEGLVKEFDLEKAFKFIVDAIYKPNVNNNKFDEEKFYYEKDYFVKKHATSIQNMYSKIYHKFHSIIDPNSILDTSYEEDTEILNNTTPEGLYEFYKECILDNNYSFYVYGDIEEERVNYLIDKYLPKQNIDKIEINTKYFNLFPMSEYKYQEIEIPYFQSDLCIEYQIENMTEKERIYLSCLSDLLRSPENKLLFENLRTKNNLIYSYDLSCYERRGLFIINAYISNKNKDKTIEVIDETINSLKDELFLKECIDKLLKGYEVDLIREKDSLSKVTSYKLNKDIKLPTLESEYKAVKGIELDKFINFINRIKKTNVVFFRGDNND